jgi:hypothetical protein
MGAVMDDLTESPLGQASAYPTQSQKTRLNGAPEIVWATRPDPLPSNSPKCDNYGSETYLGASEKCFCKCAGDSAWAQKVRGCLACAFENGMSKTGRHKMCYDAAGWGDAPYRTLLNCERKCLFSH